MTGDVPFLARGAFHGPPTVLFVDDEPLVLRSLRLSLRSTDLPVASWPNDLRKRDSRGEKTSVGVIFNWHFSILYWESVLEWRSMCVPENWELAEQRIPNLRAFCPSTVSVASSPWACFWLLDSKPLPAPERRISKHGPFRCLLTACCS